MIETRNGSDDVHCHTPIMESQRAVSNYQHGLCDIGHQGPEQKVMMRRMIFTNVVVWSLAVSWLGCGKANYETRSVSEQLTWDGGRMEELEEEFRLRCQALRPSWIKGAFWEKVDVFACILGERLSQKEIEQLIDSCKTLPRGDYRRTDRQQRVIESIIILCCRKTDRERLVQMLAKRCPWKIGADCEIEHYLALAGPGPDPILVLADAFDRCEDPLVRKDIAEALRRGFEAAGVERRKDAEFVKACREWYAKNEGKIEVVVSYGKWRGYGEIPLFVTKGSRPPRVAGSPKSRMLVDGLYDRDPAVRRSTAKTLGEERVTTAIPQLIIALLGDTDESVRKGAAEALRRIMLTRDPSTKPHR